jgi:spore coat protein CotH
VTAYTSVALLLASACAPPTTQPVAAADAAADTAADTAAPVTPDAPDVESVPGATDDPNGDLTGDLFGTTRVHAIALTVDDAGVSSLRADPYTYVPADITLDDTTYSDVGLRLKGHIGSFRDLDHKAAFKLDADQFVDGGRLLGLEKLNLHNLANDATGVRDYLAGLAYRAQGASAPRVGWARVSLNGDDYGLYALIEVYDRVWLETHRSDPDGNLYDGDYAVPDDGSYPHCDFTEEEQDNFTLDAGTDVGRADVHAVTEALQGGITAAAGLVDVPELQRSLAAEAWAGQDDGYFYNSNNYRAYFDPGLDGRVVLFPWDHEAAFNAGLPLGSPGGALAVACRADDDCHQGFVDAVAAGCAAIDLAELGPLLEGAIALVADDQSSDPRTTWTPADTQAGQDLLRRWVDERCGQMLADPAL